jgi:hypothetical protein
MRLGPGVDGSDTGRHPETFVSAHRRRKKTIGRKGFRRPQSAIIKDSRSHRKMVFVTIRNGASE